MSYPIQMFYIYTYKMCEYILYNREIYSIYIQIFKKYMLHNVINM